MGKLGYEMKNYLFLSLIILSGCSTNIANFSMVSTKLTNFDNKYESIGQIEGEDIAYIIIILPTGKIRIDRAVDNTLLTNGADYLTNTVVKNEMFVLPYIFGYNKFKVKGEGWRRKEDHQGDIFDKDISIPPATDEDDFIVIDGVKYERETAEVDSKTDPQVPPDSNKNEMQKERKIIEYNPNTGEPIYE